MEAIDLNDDVMDEGTQQLEVIENSEANRGTQPRQRRKVSRLWRKFTIMGPKQSDGKTKIRCNFCKRFYFLKLRKNGTSTLTRHMKVCPKAVGTPRSTSRKVEITDLISGSSYPTSNLYFNEIWKIECWLRAHANHSDRVICEMVESMKLKFDKYWEEYSDILAIAAVLDPRLKFEILEYCFSVLDQSTCKRRLANVRSKIYRLFGAYKKSQRISSTATTSQGETPDVPAGYGGFYTFFSQKAVGSGKSAPDIYLDEPLLDYAAHKKLNVLHYWRDNSARFKELATMAREVLSIPITTVASESSFSIGSRVLNKYRSCLLPTNVQALVCTRNWLKGFPEMDDECVEKTEEEKEEEVKQEENEEESGQSIDLT